MEEDVEIEMLLKSNEQILFGFGNSTENQHHLEDKENVEGRTNQQENYGSFLTEQTGTMVDNINHIEVDKILLSSDDISKNNETSVPVKEIRLISNIESTNGSLKNNETILQQTERFTENLDYVHINNENKDITSQNNELSLEAPVFRLENCDGDNAEGQIIDYSEEVYDLVDTNLVSYMADHPKLIPLGDNDEDNISTVIDFGNNSDDNFINEMYSDDECTATQNNVKQIQNEIQLNGNKQQPQITASVKELILAQQLIERRLLLLQELEIQVKQRSQILLEEDKQTNDDIFKLDMGEKFKERTPSYTKSFFKKFGMPYFEDKNGFTPSPNEDYKQKMKNGELIVTSIPKVHYWTKHQKDQLLEAIRQTVITENSERLMNDIAKLSKAFSTASTGDEVKEIQDKIFKCQDELRVIKNKSHSDLVSREDPDREYDWMKYSASFFYWQHSPDECKRFWNVYLKPSINKAGWDDAEDYKLLEIAEQMQFQDWDEIAKLLGTNRTAYQCLVHYQTRIQKKFEFSTGKWTEEEDKKLISIVNDSKIGNFIPWTKVSSHMGNRSHTQIYNRWNNCLNPQLVKGRFSKEEDLLIVSGIEVFGVSYNEMSSLLHNRSCAQIRERYERHLLPKTAKVGSWALEEDERLLKLVQKHGEKNWSRIAKDMKTRSRTQVRQRYAFIQNKMKTIKGWSLAQAKRRNVTASSKDRIKRTDKHVIRIKKEIEKVEKVFGLSELESDTFKIEKLKELRDKILLKSYDLKRRKIKILKEGSGINSLFLQYFIQSQPKAPRRFSELRNIKDCGAYLNEILVMARYFGFELHLPESEHEIWDNKNLSYNLKYFLEETLHIKKAKDENFSHSILPSNHGENIDYMAPEFDENIMMNEWLYLPPIDVAKLNFSEYFKRTVFDYSYGMHNDIWISKSNRTSVFNFDSIKTDISYNSEKENRLFFIPPNYFSAVAFRSILLSRFRLKRDSSDKGFGRSLYETHRPQQVFIKNDWHLHKELFLDQFQKIMLVLLCWPKIMCMTSTCSVRVINNDILSKKSSSSLQSTTNNMDISSKCSSKEEVKKRKKCSKVRLQLDKNELCLLETEERKRQLKEYRKSNRYKRKMKIEHLIDRVEPLSTGKNTVKHKRGRPRKKPNDILKKDHKSVLSKNSEQNERMTRSKSQANQKQSQEIIRTCRPISTYVRKKSKLTSLKPNGNDISKNLPNTVTNTHGVASGKNELSQLETKDLPNDVLSGNTTKETKLNTSSTNDTMNVSNSILHNPVRLSESKERLKINGDSEKLHINTSNNDETLEPIRKIKKRVEVSNKSVQHRPNKKLKYCEVQTEI